MECVGSKKTARSCSYNEDLSFGFARVAVLDLGKGLLVNGRYPCDFIRFGELNVRVYRGGTNKHQDQNATDLKYGEEN